MKSAPKKYILDAQLFIHAFRDESANEALRAFHQARAPFEYFSTIVGQELRAGVQSPSDLRALERHVLRVYARAGRLVTPTATAWLRSGDVLASMAMEDGLDLGRVSKSFGNDVLLALSCGEAGCVLVTENDRDFRRIKRFVRFDYVAPWP